MAAIANSSDSCHEAELNASCLLSDNYIASRFMGNVATAAPTARALADRRTYHLSATVTRLIKIPYAAMTVAYFFLIRNSDGREGGRGGKTAGCLGRRGGTDPAFVRSPPYPRFSVLLSSRHACPALMGGDDVRWPGPEISRHSEPRLGGLRPTRIACPNRWPLGIA